MHCTAAVQCQAQQWQGPRTSKPSRPSAPAWRQRIRQWLLHPAPGELSMVHKLPADGPLAVALLEAVQGWLQVHRPGRAHPSGSISSVVAGVLFPYLLNSKRPGEITEAEWDGLHSSYPCAHVQRGPSCRLRSRDSAVLGTRRGQEGCSPPRIAPEAP